jgi:hypothetical protein
VPSFQPRTLSSFGNDCFDLRIYSKLETCGLRMLDLSLGDWQIWYEKVWATIYLVLSDTRVLEIYLFKKLPHDEFLYDESFNSYHSHIYMLARIGKLAHRLLALCWVWSTHVRPLLRGWSCSQDQDHLHPHISCCSYPRSTQKHVFSTKKSISYTRRGSKKIVRFLNKSSKIMIYLFSKFIVS